LFFRNLIDAPKVPVESRQTGGSRELHDPRR